MHLENKQKNPQKTMENLAHLRQAYEKRLCFVKMLDFQNLRDVNYITKELNNGNILILNTEPLLSGEKNALVEVKRAIDQLRGYCRQNGGDMKRLGDYTLVVTPNRQYRIA
ncbi:MAG: cell division protein SepF [Promethearchaeota archaeon]